MSYIKFVLFLLIFFFHNWHLQALDGRELETAERNLNLLAIAVPETYSLEWIPLLRNPAVTNELSIIRNLISGQNIETMDGSILGETLEFHDISHRLLPQACTYAAQVREHPALRSSSGIDATRFELHKRLWENQIELFHQTLGLAEGKNLMRMVRSKNIYQELCDILVRSHFPIEQEIYRMADVGAQLSRFMLEENKDVERGRIFFWHSGVYQTISKIWERVYGQQQNRTTSELMVASDITCCLLQTPLQKLDDVTFFSNLIIERGQMVGFATKKAKDATNKANSYEVDIRRQGNNIDLSRKAAKWNMMALLWSQLAHTSDFFSGQALGCACLQLNQWLLSTEPAIPKGPSSGLSEPVSEIDFFGNLRGEPREFNEFRREPPGVAAASAAAQAPRGHAPSAAPVEEVNDRVIFLLVQALEEAARRPDQKSQWDEVIALLEFFQVAKTLDEAQRWLSIAETESQRILDEPAPAAQPVAAGGGGPASPADESEGMFDWILQRGIWLREKAEEELAKNTLQKSDWQKVMQTLEEYLRAEDPAEMGRFLDMAEEQAFSIITQPVSLDDLGTLKDLAQTRLADIQEELLQALVPSPERKQTLRKAQRNFKKVQKAQTAEEAQMLLSQAESIFQVDTSPPKVAEAAPRRRVGLPALPQAEEEQAQLPPAASAAAQEADEVVRKLNMEARRAREARRASQRAAYAAATSADKPEPEGKPSALVRDLKAEDKETFHPLFRIAPVNSFRCVRLLSILGVTLENREGGVRAKVMLGEGKPHMVVCHFPHRKEHTIHLDTLKLLRAMLVRMGYNEHSF